MYKGHESLYSLYRLCICVYWKSCSIKYKDIPDRVEFYIKLFRLAIGFAWIWLFVQPDCYESRIEWVMYPLYLSVIDARLVTNILCQLEAFVFVLRSGIAVAAWPVHVRRAIQLIANSLAYFCRSISMIVGSNICPPTLSLYPEKTLMHAQPCVRTSSILACIPGRSLSAILTMWAYMSRDYSEAFPWSSLHIG